MTALSGATIKKLVAEGRLAIEGFGEMNVTPNGYKLTVDHIYIPRLHWKVSRGVSSVPRHTKFTVGTRERVALPMNMYAEIHLERALCDKGVVATFPVLHAGTSGPLELTAHNKSERTIDMRPGDGFVELVFHTLDTSGGGAGPDVQAKAPWKVPGEERPSPLHGGSVCQGKGCAECCLGTEMPLTEEDVKRLLALGHEDFFDEVDGWLHLRNIDGHCVFLEDDRCIVYEDRPEGCRLYPVVFEADSGQPVMDRDCPNAHLFLLHDELEPRLNRVVDALVSERKGRKRRPKW